MKGARKGYTQEVRLLTLGHGTLTQDEIVNLVESAGITRIVDVRTTPKSRRHPWVWRERMELWVPGQAHAQYEWSPDLGGRRRANRDSRNTALRHPAFRGYADYMETQPFRDALQQLVDTLSEGTSAIMCSETLWWRCHRRLISDAAVLLHGVHVEHATARGKMQAHVATQGVRRDGDRLRYDSGAAA